MRTTTAPIRHAGRFLALASVATLLLICGPASGRATSTFESIVLSATDRPVDLSGEWRFFPGDDPAYADPAFRDDDWAAVPVPGMWLRAGIDYDGTGWYRRVVNLTEPGDLALAPPAVLFAYEAYWNGARICGLGEIGPDGSLRRRSLGLTICRIPESAQRPGDNLLAFRVRSEFGWGGFEFTGFRLGRFADVQRQLWQTIAHYGAVAAGLALFGLYHLVLFGARRQERAYYAFALLSLGFAGYVAGIKGLPLLWIDSFWASALPFYFCIAAAPYATAVFFHGLFDIPRGRMVRWSAPLTVVNVALLAASPLSEFVYGRLFYAWMPIFSLGAGVYVVYAIVLTVRAAAAGKYGARATLAGFGVVGGAILHDILVRNGLLQRPTIVEDAYLVWIATLAMTMAGKIANLHAASDRLNVELERSLATTTAYAHAVARFVPTSFVDLLHRRDITEIVAGDHSERRMAVMFADIRGFTRRSQELGANATFRLLNDALEQLLPALESHDGFVDKYLGDGVMALFDDDAGKGTGADRAVAAALDMLLRLHAFNERLRAQGTEPLAIGVGIHYGGLMLGTVGNARRLDTTAIGDTVNQASRVEALNRLYDSRIVVTEAAYNALGRNAARAGREVDLVRVAGSSQPLRVFQIETPAAAARWAPGPSWTEALERFRAGRFDDAAETFRTLAQRHPQDGALRLYLERCTKYQYLPPERWDGVVSLDKK